MVSSVGSRPTHYDTLGLASGASGEEIAQAFARKMSLFRARPMAAIAEVSAAYETLRDPAKRRAYDEALGLRPKPELRQWAFKVVQPQRAPFMVPPAMNATKERAGEITPAAEPHVTSGPEAEAPIGPKLASIAAALHELARPAAPERPPSPAPAAHAPRPRLEPDAAVGQQIGAMIQPRRVAERDLTRDAEDRPSDWTRPALVVAGLVLATGLLGALAGLSVTDNAETAQAEPAASTALPRPRPQVAAPAPVVPGAADMREEAPVSARLPAVPARRVHTRQQPGSSTGQPGGDSEAASTDPAPGELASDPLAPQPAASAPPVQASLPLPKSVIARTIERIGYPCGAVASAAAVEGAPGVFNVTCSSGHSYQATPVRGRYRFRRSGSR
jgi:hypothetical protein